MKNILNLSQIFILFVGFSANAAPPAKFISCEVTPIVAQTKGMVKLQSIKITTEVPTTLAYLDGQKCEVVSIPNAPFERVEYCVHSKPKKKLTSPYNNEYSEDWSEAEYDVGMYGYTANEGYTALGGSTFVYDKSTGELIPPKFPGGVFFPETVKYPLCKTKINPDAGCNLLYYPWYYKNLNSIISAGVKKKVISSGQLIMIESPSKCSLIN
jgi:hypothetical protein